MGHPPLALPQKHRRLLDRERMMVGARSVLLGACIAGLAVGAPAQAGTGAPAAPFPKCLGLRFGEWSQPPFLNPPKTVALDSEPVQLVGWKSLRPKTLSYRDEGRWRTVADTILQLAWSDHFVDFKVELRHDGDSLRGRAVSSNDILPPVDRVASVVGWQTACETAMDSASTKPANQHLQLTGPRWAGAVRYH
jgi:hypothetical protein